MALKDTVKHLKDLLHHVTHDLEKADKGNKAASQRVRTGTVKLEKVAKHYRKESIKTERATKGTKKTAKKTAAPKKTKSTTKHTVKSSAKSHKAKARPMSVKKPTAKLPTMFGWR